MTRMYQYLKYCSDIGLTPSHVNKLQIRQYLIPQGDSKYNQSLAALNIIYNRILNQPRKLDQLGCRKSKPKVWQVLTPEDVLSMINNTSNLKHKVIISCLYTLGLRTSELLRLEFSDIDRSSMTIHVRGGKGNKDRRLDISQELLVLIIRYYKENKPRTFVIEGSYPGVKYSSTSVSKIVKRHSTRLKKKIWPHLLRHSIATHMINSGINILQIQRFLGHNDIKTTERYYQYLKSKGIVELTGSILSQVAA